MEAQDNWKAHTA